MVENALVVHICAALEVILYSRRLLQIFVHYGLIMAFFVEDTVSSTRSYIVNLASPPIFIPHPNQHTNRISLSYTLAYAIYCGQMMHIWRLRFTLIWTIVRQSLCKKWTRLAFWRGFAGFWFELGTDFYVAFVPDSQRSWPLYPKPKNFHCAFYTITRSKSHTSYHHRTKRSSSTN